MKVIVSQTKLNVVDPTAEQVKALANLPANAIVKNVQNGYTISADAGTLFHVLYALSCNFDVELV